MSLFYRELGKGQPFVVLHGLYGSSDNWYSFAKLIDNDFRVFLVDQRNHGSSFHSDVHNYTDMSNDLKVLLEELQLNKIILLGHSMGGKTAMKFASMYPHFVKAIIIIDIAPGKYNEAEFQTLKDMRHIDIIRSLQKLPIHLLQSRKEIDVELGKSISSALVRQFLLNNLKRSKTEGFYRTLNLMALEDNIQDLYEGVVNKEYPAKSIPHLFVKGEKSPYIRNTDIQFIEQHIPNSAIEIIEGTGHWVHAEKPVAVKETIYTFLKNHSLL